MPILLDATLDPTGGLFTALPTVAGAAGSVIVVVFLFLRHLDATHERNKALLDKALDRLARAVEAAEEK